MNQFSKNFAFAIAGTIILLGSYALNVSFWVNTINRSVQSGIIDGLIKNPAGMISMVGALILAPITWIAVKWIYKLADFSKFSAVWGIVIVSLMAVSFFLTMLGAEEGETTMSKSEIQMQLVFYPLFGAIYIWLILKLTMPKKLN